MGQTTNLTVKKICHEMANYLSVLNFILEDIEDREQPEVSEMSRNIELLMYTMDFFRSIYADTINSDALMTDITKIYDIKGVKISIEGDIVLAKDEENIICGILYIIMKVSKPGDIVNITNKVNKVAIAIPERRNLPLNVARAFSEIVANDIFNVFINYVKELASRDGYKIELNNKGVVVWKE